MFTSSRYKRFILVAAAAVLLLACGDDETTPTPNSSSSGGIAGAGSGGDNTGGSGGATSGVGGQGGMEKPINGCLSTTADDELDQLQINFPWSNPHHRCVIIKPGTVIGWSGDLMLHPLAGGEVEGGVGEEDAMSNISMSDQTGAVAFVQFDELGAFPYFCKNHTADMNGVVYVVEAPGGAGGN